MLFRVGMGTVECGPREQGYEVECGPEPVICSPLDPRLASMFDIECSEDLPSNWREVAAKGGPAPWWQPGTRKAPEKKAEWIRGIPNGALLAVGGGLALLVAMGGRR